MVETGFEATADFARIPDADAIIICVPTPLNKHREPDLSFIVGTMNSIAPHLRAGPGAVAGEHDLSRHDRRRAAAAISRSAGFTHRQGFFLVFSPEREDPGNPELQHADASRRSCGGTTPACLEVGLALYGAGDRQGRAGQLDPGRRADQAAREHPPRGQHRPRQRDEDDRRQDGHRHLRGDPTRRRPSRSASCLLSGPRPRRPLHPDRSVLPDLEGARVRLHTRFIELAGEINRTMPDWVVEQGRRRAQRARQVAEGQPRCWCSASPTRRTSTTCANRRRCA